MSIIHRTCKGLVQRSAQFQQCFPRTFKNLSNVKQTQNVQASLSVSEEKLEMPDPLSYHDFFEVRKLITVKDLMDARVHYGHTTGTLNEHMKQFVLGSRLGTLIFDLDQTAELLGDALNFIAHIAFRGGIILFVTRYKQTGKMSLVGELSEADFNSIFKHVITNHSICSLESTGKHIWNTCLIEKTALECGEYCHTRNWRLGMFTDPNRYGHMTRLPDLTIFLNTLDSVFNIHKAILESNKLLIPSVGIVDTNVFPNYITYPIPGNDDTPQAIELYCKLFKEAILRGKAKRKEFIKKYSALIEAS